MPLWLPPNSNLRELAELEFSSRHLLRRGHSVEIVELSAEQGRTQVLGVVAENDPALEPYAARAVRFEAPARLVDAGGADAVFWKEEGAVVFGAYREGRCVAFSATGEARIGDEAAAACARYLMRLHAEDHLRKLPEVFLLAGEFEAEEAAALERATGATVTLAPAPIPRLPDGPADFPCPSAREARWRKEKARKAGGIALVAGSIYAAIVLGLGGSLVLGEARVREAKALAEADRAEAAKARAEAQRWRAIRAAVDPSAYALDLLAAVAAALPAETVRFTQCSIGGGRIVLTGEAAEVSQTYDLLERLKSSQALAEFEWVASPPDIASRNTVRFAVEGRRPDATADTE